MRSDESTAVVGLTEKSLVARVTNVRIKVLGPLEVVVDGDSLALGGPQQRLVLAMLVSRVNAPVSTESLIDALWAEDKAPDRARKTVQVYVANLRKALGGQDAPIESAPGGYVLRTGAVTVDAIDFEQALDATGPAADSNARHTLERLSAALGLWSGPAYNDLDDAPALTAEVTRLNELRLVALERRVEASLALGQHREVLSALETLTTDHPYRERFTALHMLALYRSGRQAEALRAYQRTRLVLGEELGIEPSPEVQALEQAILTQDPSLDLPEGSAAELASAPTDLPADTRSIRGYELREQLGESGDARLWRAYQPATGREVTLRIFGPEVANEPAFVKRFESETQRVAQLEHPHLVSIYDFWRDPGGAYVVMPLLRGGTLDNSLRRGRWRLSAALRMLDQVGSALVALHRHGLHHGSLGPDCVFLDSDTNAYVANAGIAGRPEATSGRAAETQSAASDVADLAALVALTVTPDQVPTDLAEVLDQAKDQERVEDFLRAVRQAMGSDAVGVASDLEPERPAATNPYKGLRAFQETDTADFFGRELLVSRLIETVADEPLTAVVGSSGSGKSSVVKAGLIPAVRGGSLDGDWLVAEMFPGTFPFEELEAALLAVAVDRPDGLIADLTADDRGMLRVIKRVLPDDGTGLLLVIDQFEELFSLTPDEDTRRLFLDNLVTLASDARSRVRTVLTLRADFFDRPLDHPEFGDLIRRGLVTVAMPDQDSLALMVSQPARQAGLDLEPGLVTEVVRDVIEQPGGLPLMQYALTELAERSDRRTLTLNGYRESGGVLGALGQRAEDVFQGLQPSAQAVAERIFLRLVRVDESADDTRRRIRRTELTALGLDRGAVDTVLQEFGSFRLLSFDHDPKTRGPTVEVAHEALIREWPRLRSWVDDQRESLMLERRLREAVVEWEAGDRDPGYLLRGGRLEQFETWADGAPSHVTEDERQLIAASRAAANAEGAAARRRMRRLRQLVAAVGMALVVALVAGAVAFRQRDRAEAATDDAELATLISRSAARAAEDPEISLLLALEAYRRAPGPETENAVLNALGSSGNANRTRTIDSLRDPATSCPNDGPIDDQNFAYGLLSADGFTETVVVDGRLLSHDLRTDTVTDHGPSPVACGFWVGNVAGGSTLVSSQDGLSLWYGPPEGPLDRRDFEIPRFGLTEVPGTGLLVTLLPTPAGDAISLYDLEADEPVGVLAGAGPETYFVGTVHASADGARIAVGMVDPDAADGIGRTIVIDGTTGEELFRIDSPVPADGLVIDDASGQLLAMFAESLWTIDLATAELAVEPLTTTTTSRLLDLGLEEDGTVIAVSEGQVEFLDRETGATDAPIDVRDARAARIRPDGTVVLVNSKNRFETLDLASTSLIEQTWDVEPRSHTAFAEGMAAAMVASDAPEQRRPVITDLSTGDATSYELLTPTGEYLDAAKVYPAEDGLWVFTWDNELFRWDGDGMGARLDIGGEHFNRTQFGDLIGVLSDQDDGSRVVDLVRLDGDEASVVFRRPAPDAVEVHPTIDGGVHVIDPGGTLTTYGPTGEVVGTIETEVERVGFIVVDPASGNLALVAVPEELVIVDPARGVLDRSPDVGLISTLGFGRDGELIALTLRDGTVRLWDVARGQYAGLAWSGSGQASTASPSWYDEATDTMWVASSGKYLGIPLDPDSWVERACDLVGRDLTQDEWDRFVPGDAPPQPACA